MKVALVLCLLVARAAAEPVTIPKSKALLDVPKTWTRLPDDPSLAVAFKKDASVLAVTRAAVPNISAWIPKSRDAYLQEVERGAIAAVPGTKKLARAFAIINNVPTLDLELRRPDGSQLVIRLLLFRTYALAATFELAKGTSLDEARMIAKKFTAPKSDPRN